MTAERDDRKPGGAARAQAPSLPAAAHAEHWLDEPRHVRRLWRGFLVVLALTVLAEAAIVLHPHFEAESWFGFHAAYGFVACAAMVVLAKALALLLKRPDGYYTRDDDEGRGDG